jgi:hypothetical protein
MADLAWLTSQFGASRTSGTRNRRLVARVPAGTVGSSTALPDGWDQHPPSASSQQVGDQWASRNESVALGVPSGMPNTSRLIGD